MSTIASSVITPYEPLVMEALETHQTVEIGSCHCSWLLLELWLFCWRQHTPGCTIQGESSPNCDKVWLLWIDKVLRISGSWPLRMKQDISISSRLGVPYGRGAEKVSEQEGKNKEDETPLSEWYTTLLSWVSNNHKQANKNSGGRRGLISHCWTIPYG